LVWTVAGGVPASVALEACAATGGSRPVSFVQGSDSHVGFAKPPLNAHARATFRQAGDKIAAPPQRPRFVLHTGDVSQLSKDAEFDDADQILKGVGVPVFHVPGEHDVLDEGNGQAFLARYGKGATGGGWYAFDHAGVHFVALVNVMNLKAGGL